MTVVFIWLIHNNTLCFVYFFPQLILFCFYFFPSSYAKPSLPFSWLLLEFIIFFNLYNSLYVKLYPYKKKLIIISSLRSILTYIFFEVSLNDFLFLSCHPFNHLIPVYRDTCKQNQNYQAKPAQCHTKHTLSSFSWMPKGSTQQ